VPTTDERVAYLEGRFEEHSGSVATVRSDVAAVRSDVLDLHRHVDTLHQRLSARIDGLDDKMSRQFTWLVGIQIAILIAVIGALMRVATS
jgi:hypothetical protein